MFLHRKRIKICKFIRPCDLRKIRGNVKPFQTFFEHQDDKGIPVQAFEIFPHGVNIKSEITKNVSGKIPVFRILFNIPTIFFDVLRGIVGVCVLLTPRNDIIGSSVVIFSTDTLVQVIQRKPELISVQAVSTVEFRNIALAQTGGDYDFSILFCLFIAFESCGQPCIRTHFPQTEIFVHILPPFLPIELSFGTSSYQ